LNEDSDFDLLIYSIENNASEEIIDYIFKQCHYESLNYTFFNQEYGRKSPLLSALFNNNFNIAKYLIKNGADTNYNLCYFDMFYYLDGHKKLNEKNLKFILQNNYNISSFEPYLFCLFIQQKQNNFIDIIFRETIFTNEYVLHLLNMYKNTIHVSKNDFNELIHKENNKFVVQKRYYEACIDSDNYKAFEILYNNDARDKNIILDEITKVLDSYDRIHHSNKKYKLLNKIKNNELAIEIEENLLDKIHIVDVDKVRKEISKLIKADDIGELSEYIKDNNIKLADINSEDYDNLIFSIENGTSDGMFMYLCSEGGYNTLDYYINDEKNEFLTPLIAALINEEFDKANLLFMNNADPNYNIRKYIPVDLGQKKINCIHLYLYEHDLLTENIFRYLLVSPQAGHLFFNNKMMIQYIEDSRNDLIKILYKYGCTSVSEQWYIVADANNNFEAIDILFENDKRHDATLICKYLMNYYINSSFFDFSKVLEKRAAFHDNVKNEELKEKIMTVINIVTM
ncbi:hypothetical protein PIROE2DRAFT_16030, partial [Piromyces sp. E2]